jgi:hypothetical protein
MEFKCGLDIGKSQTSQILRFVDRRSRSRINLDSPSPQLYFSLGKLGISIGDKSLIHELRTMIQNPQHQSEQQRLDGSYIKVWPVSHTGEAT